MYNTVFSMTILDVNNDTSLYNRILYSNKHVTLYLWNVYNYLLFPCLIASQTSSVKAKSSSLIITLF